MTLSPRIIGSGVQVSGTSGASKISKIVLNSSDLPFRFNYSQTAEIASYLPGRRHEGIDAEVLNRANIALGVNGLHHLSSMEGISRKFDSRIWSRAVGKGQSRDA